MNEETYYDENAYYRNDNENGGNDNSGRTGFAVASLVLGILSVLCCCCGMTVILAPLSIIFGIIALVKRHGGKPMAIVGVVLSTLAIIATIALSIFINEKLGPYIDDYMKFIQNAPQVIEEYNETGELPDYLEKYRGEEYKEFWQEGGFDDFDDFFSQFVDEVEAEVDLDSIEPKEDDVLFD
ncbi:MAG: DUF4190 domain-containing protein [Ruminococcus sp.]|nr:DUF4190 domain-containing protein [Ruminococcus sp.]